ncbi:MAG: DUF6531 domain-containing protein, partial [Methylacidiphilales bacterium]|nr:DUF6531 domain-containing protein [Candidatus Methylacidiphilales bacterium]
MKPIDGQRGVGVMAVGTPSGTAAPWYYRIQKEMRYHLRAGAPYDYPSDAGNSLGNQFQNMMAVYGYSDENSSPLFIGQVYRWVFYSGTWGADTQLRILVYQRTAFNNGAVNVAPVQTITIPLPKPGTPAWEAYLQNGFRQETTAHGLTTVLRLQNIGGQAQRWGTKYNPVFLLEHKADAAAENYYYVIEYNGYGGADENNLKPMVVTNPADPNNSKAYNRLYAMEFRTRDPWITDQINLPQFWGEPLPSAYAGKNPQELLTASGSINPTGYSTPSAAQITQYLQINNTPELRQHPTLDQLVTDMGNNPIALANFVHNEIELTDAISHNTGGNTNHPSINCGGMNRGAYATYMEGQGSPAEQCALLVYLLRKANVPAIYSFPVGNGLKMLDARMSLLLQTQIKGFLTYYPLHEDPAVPTMIPVNYPFVSAWIAAENRWVHLFPWIKDLQIKEGYDYNNYLPAAYRGSQNWIRKYFQNDPSIMDASTIAAHGGNDTPLVLLPAFIKKHLPNDVSWEKIGWKTVYRKNLYATWDDFPKPLALTGAPAQFVSLKDRTQIISGVTETMFDRIKIEVFSQENPAKKVETGWLRAMDLHNRRLIVRHEKTGANAHTVYLTLAEFHSGITGEMAFANDPDLLKKQVLSYPINASDQHTKIKVTYQRHRLSGLTDGTHPSLDNNFLDVYSRYEVTNELAPLAKGDFAAICFNFGRATPRMLRVHADATWKIEQLLDANPNASYDTEIARGAPTYLLGMSYYEQVDKERCMVESLTGARFTSFFGYGLSKLRAYRDASGNLPNNGDINLQQPSVDMSFYLLTSIGNNTFKNDSGNVSTVTNNEVLPLLITGISAQEHQILRSFYDDPDPLSTVRMLQKAASPGMLTLTKQNYAAAGEVSYTFGAHTQKLKNWDTSIWTSITNAFNPSTADNDNTVVYIPPRPTKNADNSYRGMGAMILSPNAGAALISGNLTSWNGGYGGLWSTPRYEPSNYLNFNLNYKNNSYSMAYTPPPSSSNYQLFPTNYSVSQSLSFYNQITTPSTNYFTPTPTKLLSYNSVSSYLAPSFPPVPTSIDLWNSDTFSTNRGSIYKPNWNAGATFIADPVNVVTGEFYIDVTDLTLPGPMPLQIRRNYSSFQLLPTEFGYGWKPAFIPYLTIKEGNDLIYAAELDGSVIAYRQQSDPNLYKPEPADNPTLNNVHGDILGSIGNMFNAKLVKSTSGSDTFYTLTAPDGSKRTFKVRSFPVAGNPALHRTRPYLEKWEDHAGNRYTFHFVDTTYDPQAASRPDYGLLRRIESSNGNFIGFYYDPLGRVIEAYTGDGRRVHYRYDKHGDLIAVTRPDGSTYTYEYKNESTIVNGSPQYTSTHLISREILPEGRIIENTYDNDRRVTLQKSNGGANWNIITASTFDYSVPNQTKVTDALGRHTVFHYNSQKLITKIVQPSPFLYETIQEWYLPGDNSPGAYPRSLKKTIDPRGLITEYKYDANGNLTETKITGDLKGDGVITTATTTATYNSKNLPETILDPSGITTKLYYEDPAAPYSLTKSEKLSGTTLITRTKYEYTSTGGSTPPFAKGLRFKEIRAQGTSDEALTQWTFDTRGYPTSRTRYTGTADPNIVTTFKYNDRGELIRETDALNRSIAYAYDPMGRRTWTEYRNESGSLIGWHYDYYNHAGEITWSDGPRYQTAENPAEDYVWNHYDGSGRLRQKIQWLSEPLDNGSGMFMPASPKNLATTFYDYNNAGHLTQIRSPRGHVVTLFPDELGRPVWRKQFSGEASGTPLATEFFEYEPGGLVKKHTSFIGAITENFYTSTGKLKKQILPTGQILEWRYYADGRLHKEILANGTFRETVYNDAARTITTTLRKADNTVLATHIQTYDRRGNLITEVGLEADKWQTTYDDLDRPKVRTGPAATVFSAQQKITTTYDNCGKITTVTNALNEKTITTRDILGRIESIEIKNASNALVRKTAYEYSPDHHAVTELEGTGPNQIKTKTWTNTYGLPCIVKSGFGTPHVATTLFNYDAEGHKTFHRDPSGRNTLWTYDAFGRLATERLYDGATTTFIHDAIGQLKERQLPPANNNGIQLVHYKNYYANGLLKEEYLKELVYNQITRKNTYFYYTSGPQIGLLQKRVEERGGNGGGNITHTYTYDDFSRVKQITTNASAQKHQSTTQFTYDRRGLLLDAKQSSTNHAAGPPTQVKRTWDAYGQLRSEEITIAGALHSRVSQNYDAAGRRTSLSITPSAFSSPQYEYTYRADGLLTKTRTRMPNVADYNFNYDDAGMLVNRVNSFRTQTITARNGRGQITQQNTTVNAATVLAEGIGYHADGRQSSYTATRSGAGSWNETRSYSYTLGRGWLSSESYAPAHAQTASVANTYDFGGSWLGMLTKRVQSGSGAGTIMDLTSSQVFWRAAVTAHPAYLAPILLTGTAKGAAVVRAFIDGAEVHGITHPGPADNVGAWSGTALLSPGPHTLRVQGVMPTGKTAEAQSSFNVNGSNQTREWVYDEAGNVVQIYNQAPPHYPYDLNEYDAQGRIYYRWVREADGKGTDERFIYDALGRRIKTEGWTIQNYA